MPVPEQLKKSYFKENITKVGNRIYNYYNLNQLDSHGMLKQDPSIVKDQPVEVNEYFIKGNPSHAEQ